MEEKWDYIITNRSKLFSIDFKELWRYRDLVLMYVKRDFITFYKQTILGPIWYFIQPVFTTIMFMFVFGGIAGISTDGVPQAVFYMGGLVCWNYFVDCFNRSKGTFSANKAIFGKVYFPRLAVPISNVLVQLAIFGVHFLLLLGFLLYYSVQGMICPNWTAWVFLPLVVLQVSLLGMCIGVLVSSMTTKYRDFSVLVSFGVRLWMYVSPVVYPLSQLDPGVLRVLVMLNPITAPMELFRWILLGEGTIDPLYTVGGAVLLCPIALGALYMFHRVERTFMDSV